MTRWTPNERADYLATIGADSPWLRERRDVAYRSGRPMLGDLGPVGELVSLYRDSSTWRYEQVLDLDATRSGQTLVHHVRVINTHCGCGREAEMPPVRPGDPHICGPCWREESTQDRAAQVDADLAARTAAHDLAELVGLYQRPGGMSNVLTR